MSYVNIVNYVNNVCPFSSVLVCSVLIPLDPLSQTGTDAQTRWASWWLIHRTLETRFHWNLRCCCCSCPPGSPQKRNAGVQEVWWILHGLQDLHTECCCPGGARHLCWRRLCCCCCLEQKGYFHGRTHSVRPLAPGWEECCGCLRCWHGSDGC